LLVFLITIHC